MYSVNLVRFFLVFYFFGNTTGFLYPIVSPAHELYKYVPPETEVTFHLYHFSDFSKNDQIDLDDKNSLERSRFNPHLPVKIVIHGWTHEKDVPWLKEMREAMSLRNEWNIIVVDWGKLARVPYVEARIHVPIVGKHLAKFILFIQKCSNLPLLAFHLIGHSMGAQAAAFAGHKVQIDNGGILGRITGLDPASPLYEWPHMEDRDEVLDPSDAAFVDVIHTNSRQLGMITPAGHVDYYPNGGERQPGCATLMCNHMRAVEYWTASIKNPALFKAYSYEHWNEFHDSGDINDIPHYPMGIDAGPFIPYGSYFLEPNDEFLAYIATTTTLQDSFDINLSNMHLDSFNDMMFY